MQLEMICTGEEVLSGQIVDTNAAWFANAMMELGIELQFRCTVGDRMDDLMRVFTERSHHADVILVNGGLGPTSDDLCCEAIARAAGVALVEHSGWRQHLQDWFKRRKREMPASNLKQCLLPQGAILVDNPQGSAPGFRIKFNRAWLFFTPGVPAEFKPMVQEQFIPFIRGAFGPGAATQLYKLLTFGHGESALAERLGPLTPPAGITLGYRPSLPYVEIKIFARGESASAALPAYLDTLRAALGEVIVSENQGDLAALVHDLLIQKGRTLSLAESCTGGMLSSLLVEHPGSSAYLQQAVVCYSKAAKQKLLGVSAATLEIHGAVSAQCALEMCSGARALLDSDFALAVTGIAGPDGGGEDKPVGTVAVALSDRTERWVQVVALAQRSRGAVRVMSAALALDMLRRRLLEQEVFATYSFIPAQEQRRERHH
ncbi:MAG: CinA family nicotinamide mononucleotide deamidase-related protein [Pseudomonadales bacterium]|jgi:nicotinamide-nucleotide amidase|nr:CinA family nicotinamide mononucleotide deamidase-related protein [Pseudomonadales bacterium]